MSTFTVKIEGIDAVEQVLSAKGFEEAAGPEIEQAVIAAATAFRARVREEAPIGRGRLSQWQRRSGKGHGSLRKSASVSSKRAGFDTTSRVRVGPIANIVRSGAKPHDIRPLHGRFLLIGDHYIFGAIHHPGAKANNFWARAASSVDGEIQSIAGKVPFATADKMAARIARR